MLDLNVHKMKSIINEQRRNGNYEVKQISERISFYKFRFKNEENFQNKNMKNLLNLRIHSNKSINYYDQTEYTYTNK